MAALAAGTEAPDFALKDQDRNEVKLSDYRGTSPVVLVFYPFTFTAVCEGELCQLRDDLARYESAGVKLFAISCDSPFVQKKWADEMGYGFQLLADNWPHGEVARAYGVFNEALGCANRGTFVIDTNGVIVDSIETANLGTAREPAWYAAALAKVTG